MSMVALAMRLSAVLALNGSTVAGKRVFDSAVLPIDKLTSEMPEPFISVSTEEESGKPAGRDINNGDRLIDLVIETAVGKTIQFEGDDGQGLMVADTDGNLELSLAVLSRQIDACLWGKGGGAWGEVFRAFSKTIAETTSRRGLPTDDGERFAARQVVYRVQAFAEPAFGAVEPGTPFGKFLAALDEQPGYENIAAIVRQAIEGKPIGWPDLYTPSAVAAGMTEAEAQRMGIAPLGGYPSDPMKAAEVYPAGWEIDQVEIGLTLPEDASE